MTTSTASAAAALVPDGQSKEGGSEQALVRFTEQPSSIASIAADGPLSRLPVELEVGVPLRDFRVRNLLCLDQGAVVESQWGHAEDVPIAAGKVQLAWAEFEVMDLGLAVRVTRLA
jgi:flagellar motor switch/type III secretory pathway protein FliN